MSVRTPSTALFMASLLVLAACKKTGTADRPSRTITRAKSGSTASSPTSEPESQPASRPLSEPEGADIGPGPWIYRHSVGTAGEQPGTFREPIGLAVTTDGHLFVSDAGNERMQMLAAATDPRVFAEGIGRPMHLSWSSDGHLVVAVFLEDRIRIFDGTEESGAFGGEWLDAPSAAVQGSDGRYYVSDFYHHQLHIVSAEGKRLRSIGSEGESDGQFTYPTDVALDPDGNVWVADAYAHRIQKFDDDGTHLQTIGGRGTTPGMFEVATGIDVGPDGTIYVADFDNHRVQILAHDGTPKAIVGPGEDGDAAMKHPTDVVVAEDQLYVVDHGHHQIDVWERR